MRGMEYAHTSTNQGFLDHLLNDSENGPKIREEILTKRIQFDTTPVLFAELEKICALLSCSKREFLEMVVCEGIERASSVFAETYEQVSGRALGEIEA